MKRLLFLLLPALCFAGEFHYYCNDSGFMTIEHLTKTFDYNGHWFSDVDIHTMSHADGLKVICFNWLNSDTEKRTTLNEFAVLARHWKPSDKPPVIEPNEPPVIIPDPNTPPVSVMVWTAFNSEVYHKWDKSCRYWRDTMLYIDVIEALKLGKRPCSVCKPVFAE